MKVLHFWNLLKLWLIKFLMCVDIFLSSVSVAVPIYVKCWNDKENLECIELRLNNYSVCKRVRQTTQVDIQTRLVFQKLDRGKKRLNNELCPQLLIHINCLNISFHLKIYNSYSYGIQSHHNSSLIDRKSGSRVANTIN